MVDRQAVKRYQVGLYSRKYFSVGIFFSLLYSLVTFFRTVMKFGSASVLPHTPETIVARSSP
jgi:hypothetical protein